MLVILLSIFAGLQFFSAVAVTANPRVPGSFKRVTLIYNAVFVPVLVLAAITLVR